MGWLLAFGLWLSAFLLLRRWSTLKTEEVFLASGLLTCLEAIGTVLMLGWRGILWPLPTRALTCVFIGAQVITGLFSDGLPQCRSRPIRWTLYWPRVFWPAVLATVTVLAFWLFLASALPPDSWDGLTYHLPMRLRWLQQGNFDLSGWPSYMRFYPWNSELISTWLSLLAGGQLDISKLSQVLALPLLGASGFILGRRLAGPSWAAACAVGLVSVPLTIIQAGYPYVDVFYASFWLAAAASALCYERAREEERVYLVMYALAFGLAVGAKPSFYFDAPLLLPLVWTFWRRPSLRAPAARIVPALLAVALLAGGTSLLRNWLSTGNPVYPFHIHFAGLTFFRGFLDPAQFPDAIAQFFITSKIDWFRYPFHETFKGATVYTVENGFGPLFAAGLIFIPYVLWNAWQREDHGALGFLIQLPICLALFFLVHPFHEPRHILFLTGVALPGLAYALHSLTGPLKRWAQVGWSLGILWGLCGVVGYVGHVTPLQRSWRTLRADARVDPLEYYRWQYPSLGEAWTLLNNRLRSGELVVTNAEDLILPWTGVPSRGRVLIVRHWRSPYPDSFWATTSESWVALLDRLQAHYVALWTPPWYPYQGPAERASIARYPKRFHRLGKWMSIDYGTVELYDFRSRAR